MTSHLPRFATPVAALRAAAVLTLLYAAGHMSGAPWQPSEGPEGAAVLEQMQSVRFAVEGVTRTYFDFYFGFGVIIGGLQVVIAIALWQLGTIARTAPRAVEGMAWTMALCFAVNTVLCVLYFFAAPTVFAVAITLCCVAAAVLARRAV